tara:strand:+ start:242 stop:946 length:705 start_codon:yes stop_codon:yes gene_type:complete
MKKFDLIILCGGFGKRIRSKSKNLPKILIDVQKNKPFIFFLLKSLKVRLFNNIILSIGYRRQKILNFLKKNKQLNLSYVIEKKPLGTGGAIKNTLKNKKISNPFFVVNGDTFYQFNVKELIKKNSKNKIKKSIILLKKNEKEKRYDQFQISKKNKITMIGKFKKGNFYINSGFYMFYKKDFILKKNRFSLEKDLIPNLINKNKLDFYTNKSKIFFDIGVPKSLYKFKSYINKNF